MLKKELLLQQFVSGWRELTVSKIYAYVDGYFGWLKGREWISDNTVNGDPFTGLYGWHSSSASSGWRYGTRIDVDQYYWPSLYVKREGGEVLQLTKYQGEGYSYAIRSNSSNVQTIFEEDLGKTINIYVGTTPPPIKYKRKPLERKHRKAYSLI